jgi:hypothetical protein
MSTRERICRRVGGLLCIIAILLATSCSREHDSGPIVNGRPLSYWLLKLVDKSGTAAERTSADRAVKLLGTNALPYLIIGLSLPETTEDSPSYSAQQLQRAITLSGGAVAAFGVLGRDAAYATPDLAKLMSSQNYYTVQNAATVLSKLGPIGARTMIGGLTNRNPSIHLATSSLLMTMGTNLDAEVPALFASLDHLDTPAAFNCCYAIIHSGVSLSDLLPQYIARLASTNAGTRYVAAMTLGRMGTNASEAIPHLEKVGGDSSKDVRDAAEWALAQIKRKD